MMSAQYSLSKESTIVVQSNCFVGSARNMSGDFVPACPGIEITAKFIGEWDNDEMLNRDMNDCLKKLNEAFAMHLSGGSYENRNHCNNNGKQNGFQNFLKNP